MDLTIALTQQESKKYWKGGGVVFFFLAADVCLSPFDGQKAIWRYKNNVLRHYTITSGKMNARALIDWGETQVK